MKNKINQALLWSQKYTKTDMKYLASGSFWLTTAKILSSLASFISSVAFANLLPEETYGNFRYVLSIAGLLAIPTIHGIETSLTRSIAQGYGADAELALKTRVKWGILGGVASLFLAAYYFYAGNITLCLSFLIAAIFVPLMDSFNIYTSVLNGKKKFDVLARDVVITRMSVALLLAGLVFFTDNVLVVLFCFFFVTTVLRFGFLQHVLKKEIRNEHSDPEMIGYGKHLSLIGILGRISTQMDKILVFHYLGGAPLAAFYIAFMPLKFTQNILNSISILALPKLSTNSKEEIKRTLPPKVFKLYLLIVPIVILFELVAPFIFEFVYPKYSESILMAQLLFLLLLLFPLSLFGTALTAQEEKKKLYINSTVFGVVRIILLFLLVPTYGVFGAIGAILLTSLISNVVLLFLFFKRM